MAKDARELSASIQLDVHRHGGHVGFVAGNLPWRPLYWLEQRIPRWLLQQLTQDAGGQGQASEDLAAGGGKRPGRGSGSG